MTSFDLRGPLGDFEGYGIGRIDSINESYFLVKFKRRELKVLYNQFLFRWDTAGRKGSRRAYTLKEFLKKWNSEELNKDCLNEELLKEALEYSTSAK